MYIHVCPKCKREVEAHSNAGCLHDAIKRANTAEALVAELEKALKQVRREARLIFFSQAARRIERTCDKARAEGEEKEG